MGKEAFEFSGPLELFPQQGGWHYVRAPKKISEPLLPFADRGLIAIEATIGDSTWPTSLLPMGDGTHFIAVPAKVRNKEKLELGDTVKLNFVLRER